MIINYNEGNKKLISPPALLLGLLGVCIPGAKTTPTTGSPWMSVVVLGYLCTPAIHVGHLWGCPTSMAQCVHFLGWHEPKYPSA